MQTATNQPGTLVLVISNLSENVLCFIRLLRHTARFQIYFVSLHRFKNIVVGIIFTFPLLFHFKIKKVLILSIISFCVAEWCKNHLHLWGRQVFGKFRGCVYRIRNFNTYKTCIGTCLPFYHTLTLKLFLPSHTFAL